MKKLKALVLAAGMSTRIAPVTGGHPKPLIRIRGETILGRNLRWLGEEGVREVWINLHYRPDEIIAAIGDGSRFGVTVRYIHEPEILGTAGAVRNLSSEWVNTFLVAYGDNLVRMDLSEFCDFHRRQRAVTSVALFDCRRHAHSSVAGGRVKLARDNRIVAFHEGSSDRTLPLVNAGVYLLEPEVVEDIPASQFYDFGKHLFPSLVASAKALYGYVIRGYCLGLDTPESYQQAIGLIRERKLELP